MHAYDPEASLPLMKQIAKDAGAILMQYFESSDLQVNTKFNAADIVTRADLESDKFIRGKFRELFPNAGVITEEGKNIQPPNPGPSEVWFCADPLDGTTNYSCNMPHFCVSIGMLDQNHQPLAGVVFDPNRNETFYALRGKGSFLEGPKGTVRRLHVRENTELLPCLVVTGFNPTHLTSPDNNIAELSKVLPKVRCIRRLGSACLDFCWVAAARFDAYFEKGPHIWDVAAGWLIAMEAGASVTDYHGKTWTRESLQAPMLSLIVACPAIHDLLQQNIEIARAGMKD